MNYKAPISLLFLILFWACGSSRKSQPEPDQFENSPGIFKIDTSTGYTINHTSQDSIKDLYNSFGKKLVTGKPVRIEGTVLSESDMGKPEMVIAKKPKLIPPKKEKVSNLAMISRFKFNLKNLKPVTEIKKDSVGILTNSTGDTIPTGIPIPISGRIVPCIQPKPIQSSHSRFMESNSANIRYIGTDQGLPSQFIFSFCMDHKNRLWFGSLGGGASCFDGSTLINFTKKEGLTGNWVRVVFQDSKKNIWLGTENGISLYDGEKFIHYTEEEGLSKNRISSIFEDSKQNIWIGSLGGGVSKFRNDSITHFSYKEGLTNPTIRSIDEDKAGRIWFASKAGIFFYHNRSFSQLSQSDGLCSNKISAVKVDTKGNIWIGSEDNGLNIYDGKHISHYSFSNIQKKDVIWSFYEDSDHKMWIPIWDKGVYQYDNNRFMLYSREEGLSNNFILEILEDNIGNIWFTTWGGGINILNKHSFKDFSNQHDQDIIRLRCITEDSLENKWIGSIDRGWFFYDGTTICQYTMDEGLMNNYTECLITDHKNNVWAGTWGGIIKYDGKCFTNYPLLYKEEKIVIESLLQDRKGNIWIGTMKHGIIKFDGTEFTLFNEENGFNAVRVNSITEDFEGNIWFGSKNCGVTRYDGEYFTTFTEKEGLSSNHISCLTKRNGKVWVGTRDNGINVIGKKHVITINTKQGLSNNLVTSLKEDHLGRVWCGTDNGLNLLNLGESSSTNENMHPSLLDFKIYNFNKQDGLRGNNFHQGFAMESRTNVMWWLCGDAITTLDLNQFVPPTIQPTVDISSIEINDSYIDFRHEKSQNQENEIEISRFNNYPDKMKLPHDQNHLTFHFSSIDWSASQNVQYSYKLDDEQWSTASKVANASYRNIEYGDHIFKVRAIGSARIWSKTFNYPFRVSPPWWLSGPIKVAYAVVLVLFIYLVILLRTRKLNQSKNMLKIQVEKATHNLLLKNQEIQAQKESLEHKHVEITDSIIYAKRIQKAILPPKRVIDKCFSEYFIFYEPKDVVAGDFYWIRIIQDMVIFGVADCTGHGVPGAMVSVVCNYALNRSTGEFNLTDPGRILDSSRTLVIREFEKSDEEVKDGMDIALCTFDGNNLYYSGAYNPLWVIRDNELIEIKADRQPIGKYVNQTSFKTHHFPLQKDDLIYLCSDGYADQFGGELNKKFKSKRLKELLLQIRHQPLEQQKITLKETILKWRGNIEQLDDICIVGIKV